MGIFSRIRSAFSNDDACTSVDAHPPTITVYDAFGRQLEIPRSQWESDVLPDSLTEAADDPDRLYSTIAAALEDGFVEALVAPSQRLLEIDPNCERSATVRGIVLMKIGDRDGAQRVLTEYAERYGTSGIVLTNLAKVQDAMGRHAEAEATLCNALEIDPNQDNGLLWWCAIQRDKTGDQADFWTAMRKAALFKGSWRPQLWLAREALEQHDLARATQLYQHVLASAVDEPEVLMMISGDLGNHGHVDKMLEIILPVYDPARHDAWTGLNLLEACLATNNLAEGEALLHRMFALNLPPLKERLFHYSTEFDKLRASSPRRLANDDEPIKLEVVAFDRPIWNYGLCNPTWLFSSGLERSDEVALLPLANVTPTDLCSPTAQREDELGRLTRSVPLYLAESLYFWSSLRPKFVLPVVRGGGPIVVGAPWPDEQIFQLADGARFAISGSIEQSNGKLRVEVLIWDCLVRQVAERLMYYSTIEELGETTYRIERDVLAQLTESGASAAPCESYYERPEEDAMSPHLTCLGQALMLSLVQNDVVTKDSLWGERNILEYSLWNALHARQRNVPKILFTGAVVKSHEFGSGVFAEFKRQALQLVAEEKDPTTPFYRLSPLLLRIFDPEMFHLRKAELLAGADKEYRQWLELIVL